MGWTRRAGSGDESTSTGPETGEPEISPCETVEVEGAGSFEAVIEGVDAPIIVSVEDVCNAAEDAAGLEVCQASGLTADDPGDDEVDDEQLYRVLVYRPDADMGAWPEDPLPLVVFIPGNGQFLFQQEIEGIQEEDPFPPRGVVVEATGIVDGFPIYSRAPIESPIFYQAGVGWILLQGTGGSYLEFEVPCNGEIADVKVAWGFEEVATNEAPPSVSITELPSSVSCPDMLALLVSSAADPDNDIVSLRWIVDGILLEDPYPTIAFTQAHEVTAIVRDARGATTTDTKLITCI